MYFYLSSRVSRLLLLIICLSLCFFCSLMLFWYSIYYNLILLGFCVHVCIKSIRDDNIIFEHFRGRKHLLRESKGRIFTSSHMLIDYQPGFKRRRVNPWEKAHETHKNTWKRTHAVWGKTFRNAADGSELEQCGVRTGINRKKYWMFFSMKLTIPRCCAVGGVELQRRVKAF